MAQFNVHFFKEKSRHIDIEVLIDFFEKVEGVTVEMDDQSVRFLYTHPHLPYQALFKITPKSEVPDIYRLNPRFLDVNFHMEMPILTPNYIAKHIFDVIKKICDKFGFHIYNEMFEDVLAFKMELLDKVFHMLKDAYIEKNPVLLNDYFVLPTEKLTAVFRYLDDIVELQNYYKELDTYVPKYHFLSTESHHLTIGIEWNEQTLTVFPPCIDYVFYRLNGEIKVIVADEVLEALDKFVTDVPGFIRGTKVLTKKFLRKAHKIMRKSKFSKIDHTFEKQTVRKLLD